MIKNCLHCNNEFTKVIHCSIKKWGITKFCSRKCFYEYKRIEKSCSNCEKKFIVIKSSLHREFCSIQCSNKEGKWLGKTRDEQTKEKISKKNKGKRFSISSEFKKGHKSLRKGKKFLEICGSKHWNWKGGVTSITDVIRNSVEYNTWRKEVYKRDYWTCKICDVKQRFPVAHHIKSFKHFPEDRFDIDNGVTLCRSCHIKVHQKNGVLQEIGTYQFIFS